MSKRKKKYKNKKRWNDWQRLSHNTVIAEPDIASTEEINQIAVSIFGGLKVSAKDL